MAESSTRGATEFHVNLITHPTPKRASDCYTQLEMQWQGMCEAVLAIDPAAWGGAASPSASGRTAWYSCMTTA